MAVSPSRNGIIRFATFELDVRSGELRKNGVRLKLSGQPFQVLRILAERSGEVVTRDELQKILWPDTFVDVDHNLNTAVNRIREALGDLAENPRFIETLPRRGYRFIGPLNGHDTALESAPDGPAAIPTTSEQLRPPEVKIASRMWTAVAILAGILLLTVGVWRVLRVPPPSLPPMEVVPIVGLNGREVSPAFSPDGKQIAFVLEAENGSGIYVSLVSGGKPLRLTSDPQDDYPKWSPDSEQIAFVRPTERGVAIYSVPALGGVEQRLYSGPAGSAPSAFDWSPDGKYLAISQAEPDKTHAKITLVSLGDSKTRPLTTPSEQDLDYAPAFSPDGLTIAFVRSNVGGMVNEVYVVPSGGGEAKRLTFDHRTIFGTLAWTPDGNEVLFSASSSDSPTLWRVPLSGRGTPRLVLGPGANAGSPATSRKGSDLAFQQSSYRDDIWQVHLRYNETPRGVPELLIPAMGFNIRPLYSPDGKKIVLQSTRTGYNEIWICDRDGSSCNAVTHFKGLAGAPQWSPDGKTVAFEFHPKDYTEVYVTEVGGNPHSIPTFPDADNGGPVWSRDGKWLYFYSDSQGGRFQIWKTNIGGGPPVQVTKNGGIFGLESPDGQFFYFAKFDEPGIWRMPINGGDETKIMDNPGGSVEWSNWALTSDGIYFVDLGSSDNKVSIQFYEFANNRKIPILTMARRPCLGLGISPDGKSLLFTQENLSESRVMLVKNFWQPRGVSPQ